MSKKLNENKITNELKEASAFFQKSDQPADLTDDEPHSESSDQPGDPMIERPNGESIEQSKTPTRDSTLKSTRVRGTSRDNLRDTSRDNLRNTPRALPSRDEIQGFSFQLRDELKVKVQAEVPHYWQTELEEIAHELDVKKLELYRFILGEFLGKVKRQGEPK